MVLVGHNTSPEGLADEQDPDTVTKSVTLLMLVVVLVVVVVMFCVTTWTFVTVVAGPGTEIRLVSVDVWKFISVLRLVGPATVT